MTTVAQIQAEKLRIAGERNKLLQLQRSLDDGEERDAIVAQRAALQKELVVLERELEVASNQSPATGEFEGRDRNSGAFRYKNPVTGESFLSNTAPTESQQQQSGLTPDLDIGSNPVRQATEAQPATAPAEIQTPAAAPVLVDNLESAPVDPATDPTARSGDTPTVPPADVRDQAEIPTNTDGYGSQNEVAVSAADRRTSADPVTPTSAVGYGDEPAETGDQFTTDSLGNTFKNGALYRAAEVDDATGLPLNSQNRVQVGTIQAQRQQTTRALAQFPVNTDWRVVLRLAPGANYLYAAADAGLLQPLKTTNGVVFPYTPTITTAYRADYQNYDLTHSNYRGYFYKSSYIDDIQLGCTFTAQSTADAAYVLAVIHFFRSVTKMFYGQDAQRGSPPPLVYLSGLGDYQFNNHPCVVSQFNYKLPADVDYISSGSPNNLGLNLQPLQNLYSTTLNAVAPTVTRLATAFLPRGAENERPAPLQALLNNPTYVPSKIDIDIVLKPIQTRSQVSKQFSLKNFANGNLLKGGFW